MSIIVYKKIDFSKLAIYNSIDDLNMDNIINNHGGTEDNYGIIEVEDSNCIISQNELNEIVLTTPTQTETPLEQIKTNKIEQFRSECNQKIINEFYSSCTGELKRYDCEIYDQVNIQGNAQVAQLVLMGQSTEIIKYKSSDELLCSEYTPQQILQLGFDLKKHIEEKTDRFNQLRVYILDENRIKEDIELLNWDSVIQ